MFLDITCWLLTLKLNLIDRFSESMTSETLLVTIWVIQACISISINEIWRNHKIAVPSAEVSNCGWSKMVLVMEWQCKWLCKREVKIVP